MNILIDYHHDALLTSLYKLFVERLGWNLYIPIGMDWYDEEYWSVENGEKTPHTFEIAKLYLLTPANPSFHRKTPETPRLKFAYLKDIKAGLKFDIVLASVPCRYPNFEKLVKDFDMKSKLIFQAGNNFSHNSEFIQNVKNLLSSATGPYHYMNVPNKVFYHQEFDLGLFCPETPEPKQNVTNFQHFMCKPQMFYDIEQLLPEWKFRAFGSGNRDLVITGIHKVAAWTRKAGFIWHVKTLDEGYGHIIHTAFACGKPLIIDTSYMTVYHQGVIPNTCMALFTSDTIIDVKVFDTTQKITEELIRREKDYDYYSEKVYQKFTEVVNFDSEFVEIKKFLERLV